MVLALVQEDPVVVVDLGVVGPLRSIRVDADANDILVSDVGQRHILKVDDHLVLVLALIKSLVIHHLNLLQSCRHLLLHQVLGDLESAVA